MDDEELGWLDAVRADPGDARALEALLRQVDPWIRAAAARWPDPDEVAQRARLRVWRGAARCRATRPASLRSWVRTVVRRCGATRHDEGERRTALHDAAPPPQALPAPDAAVSAREEGARLQAWVEAALDVTPATLPPPHRAWARRHHVAATEPGRRRDVAIARRIVGEDEPAADVAEALGLTVSAVRKAASRGLAAIRLGQRLVEVPADRIRAGIRIPSASSGPPSRGPPMLQESLGDAAMAPTPRAGPPVPSIRGGCMVTPAVRVVVCPGPFRSLVGVAAGEPGAVDGFARWVLGHPEARRVPAEDRGDVLHDVVLALLERAGRVVEALTSVPDGPRAGKEADRRLHAYVAAAIANRYRSTLRAARRAVALLDPASVPAPQVEPSVLEHGLRVLDLLEAEVLAAARHPAEVRRTLAELRDLALGDRRMGEVVRDELPAPTDAQDARRARDRLYVRHRRMRGALVAAAARLQAVGALDADEVQLAGCVVSGLLTRRRVR